MSRALAFRVSGRALRRGLSLGRCYCSFTGLGISRAYVMMRGMNIATLRIFCDIVRYQSFSRGAAANDVSQSAATQSVHRVERYFDTQLIDRTKRPFVFTPEGQTCYDGFR